MITGLKHLLLPAVAALIVAALPSVAQESDRKKAPPKQQPPRAITVKLSVDQEDNALEFAKTHHPELARLLEQLRKTAPSGFNRGIREVYTAAQRLERYRDKQPARFELELQNWKTDSKIRLLTARWIMSQDPKLEKEIRALLRSRQQARIDRLKADRKKLTERLKQLDKQIGMGTADLEADLEAEWDKLTKRAAVSAKTKKRPAAKPDANDKTKAKAKSNTKPSKTKP